MYPVAAMFIGTGVFLYLASVNERMLKSPKGQILITTGFYAMTRNPQYLSYLPMFFGAMIATDSLWIFMAMISTFLLIATFTLPAEEDALSRSHPNWYLYVERSPQWWGLSGGLAETRWDDDAGSHGIAGITTEHETNEDPWDKLLHSEQKDDAVEAASDPYDHKKDDLDDM